MGNQWVTVLVLVPRNARLDKTRRIAPPGHGPPSPKCRRPTRAATGDHYWGQLVARTWRCSSVRVHAAERQIYQTNPISHNPHRFSILLPISEMPGGRVPEEFTARGWCRLRTPAAFRPLAGTGACGAAVASENRTAAGASAALIAAH